MRKFEKAVPVMGITLLVVVALALVFGVLFFGMAGLFTLLGVGYKSNVSLLMFVVSIFLLGVFFDLFANVFIKLALDHVVGTLNALMVRLLIDGFFNWFAIHIVDEFMTSIDIPLKIEVIVAMLIGLIELAFDNNVSGKKKSKKVS